MLANRRMWGNMGRSFLLAGNVPAPTAAWNGWLRTVCAAGMPKTAAVPSGYGISSLAPPKEAGAFTSRALSFQMDESAVGVGDALRDASASFQIDAASTAEGQGIPSATASVQIDLSGDLAALAPFESAVSLQIDLSGDIGASAPFESTVDFQIDMTGELSAIAPAEATISLQLDLVAAGSGDYDGVANASFQLDLSAIDLTGAAEFDATLPFSGTVGEITSEAIAAAVLAAAQATPIHSDVQRVRSQPLQGAGTEGSPWGPA